MVRSIRDFMQFTSNVALVESFVLRRRATSKPSKLLQRYKTVFSAWMP